MEIITGKVLPLISVVLTFGFAIFVHELGHFLMARIRGVGVEAFAIGMGPKIVGWTRGGTEYSLRWFPVGGFVKLHQMIREEAEEDEQDEAEAVATGTKSLGESAHADMEALYDKGLVTKLMVFMGGVTFNVLAAMVATAFLFGIGFKRPAPLLAWVGELSETSTLHSAGLREGDYIVAIAGTPLAGAADAETALGEFIADETAGDTISIEVERGDKTQAIDLGPLDGASREEFFADLTWAAKPYVGMVMPYQPAAKAGMLDGDLIVSIDGKPIETWNAMTQIVQAGLGNPLMFEVARADSEEIERLVIEPIENPTVEGQGQGIIGISLGTGAEVVVKEPFLTATVKAPGRTLETLGNLIRMQAGIFKQLTPKGLRQSVGGPIAIMGMSYKKAQRGVSDALDWFITLNLILAFMNMLPIPILDGGFVVLSVIEAATRRPVSPRILGPVYTFFALCFISLLVLISYKDVLNIFF